MKEIKETLKKLQTIDKDYEITEQPKQEIWNNLNISGSKFKQWCIKPDIFVLNEKKEFPEFMKEKLDFGNKLEDFIFDTAKNSNKKYNFIKDKKTYQHKEYKYCFANVDGFFLDKNNEKGILEIKNTEMSNIDKLIDNYKYQVLYYCWFFGLKKVMFAFLINGCRFRIAEFEFNDEDIKWALNRILEFGHYLKTKEIPKINKFIIEKNDNDEIEKTLADYDNKINIFQDLKNEIENLERIIKEHCEKTQNKLESEKFIFSTFTSSKKVLDKEKVQEFIKVSNLDFSKFEKTTSYTTLKKTKKE